MDLLLIKDKGWGTLCVSLVWFCCSAYLIVFVIFFGLGIRHGWIDILWYWRVLASKKKIDYCLWDF